MEHGGDAEAAAGAAAASALDVDTLAAVTDADLSRLGAALERAVADGTGGAVREAAPLDDVPTASLEWRLLSEFYAATLMEASATRAGATAPTVQTEQREEYLQRRLASCRAARAAYRRHVRNVRRRLRTSEDARDESVDGADGSDGDSDEIDENESAGTAAVAAPEPPLRGASQRQRQGGRHPLRSARAAKIAALKERRELHLRAERLGLLRRCDRIGCTLLALSAAARDATRAEDTEREEAIREFVIRLARLALQVSRQQAASLRDEAHVVSQLLRGEARAAGRSPRDDRRQEWAPTEQAQRPAFTHIGAPGAAPLTASSTGELRERMRQQVFRPSHAQPTVTVEQWGEVERAHAAATTRARNERAMQAARESNESARPRASRGDSGDADDDDDDEDARRRQRALDEWRDEHRRGSGNRYRHG